jgi:hypothetical protein
MWFAPLAGNPLGYTLACLCHKDLPLQHCIMVWEDYFTSGTKLGSRKVEYFTTELISRVLDSKLSKLLVLKSSNEKYDNNPECLRSAHLISFIAPVYPYVELVNP